MSHQGLKRSMRLLPLVMTMYFCVSGGPIGLEPLIKNSGAGMAIALILITPIIWALPASLMTAELASAIPAEGGYFIWVRTALGPFWGFLCAFWTWMYTWFDSSIYPVLFSTLMATTLRSEGLPWLADHSWAQFGISVLMIVAISALNIRGTRQAGESSVAFSVILLLPFILMVLVAAAHFAQHPVQVLTPFAVGQTPIKGFGLGLTVVMWNYLGYDSISTIAEEVENPRRNFPRALAYMMPLIVLSYLLPVIFGLAALPDISKWSDGSWPVIAAAIGGRWLGLAVAVGAMFSLLGLFNATLLAASRIPLVLAEDGYLPKILTRIHPKFGTPWVSILACTLIYAICASQHFDDLIVANVLLYSCALLLEFLALIALRKSQPGLERPFRVPGGMPAAWLLFLFPAAVVLTTVFGNAAQQGWGKLLPILALILVPPILFVLINVARKDRSNAIK